MTPREQIQKNLRCPYCGLNPDMEPEQMFECIDGCTNCKTDLTGEWRNIANNVLKIAAEKYGIEQLKLMYEKYMFTKI